MNNTFLTAAWNKLMMVNYEIDPSLLQSFIPAHTQLDLWNGKCFVSLIGFMFEHVKVKGFSIPFHKNFEEINLRFYVSHGKGDNLKRGVVFIKEFVPKPAITFVANTIFRENYATKKMYHNWQNNIQSLQIEYALLDIKKHTMHISCENKLQDIEPNSIQEFIAEHYWGYAKVDSIYSNAYEVTHPKWQVYPTINYSIDFDFKELYGPQFSSLNNQNPHSVFLAEGSAIAVKSATKILK
jgi:uncharacterized protein YqjF (DUF2071 family)